MQVLTHFPLLKALGWALFNSLWQMAALWLLYRLLIAIFHTAAANIRHGLALSLLNIGALWTGVTFIAASLFPDNGNTAWLGILSPGHSTPGWFWETSRSFTDMVLSYGSTLYLLILSGLLIRYSSHYWHTRKLTFKGLAAMPAEYRVFVNATALQLNIPKPVKTWLSSFIDVPLTLGFLKPVILLPAAMISQLSPHQIEAILIHELGHIRRKDYLLHLAVTVLEGLFFFNPFSRLLIRELKKEREHCCDDLVLQFKYDPHAYISALLALATGQQPGLKLAVAATGGSDKLLLQRARRILLRQDGDRSRPGIRSLVLILFTGLITALALSRPISVARRTATITTIQTSIASPSIAVASPGEISYIHPIHSAPPTVRKHLQARTAPHNTPEPESPQTDDNTPVFTTSSDELTDLDNSTPGAGTRDFSMNVPGAISGPAISFLQGVPVVPNSSFSFRYTEGDSTKPEERLLYLQQSARRDVLAAIAKLQQETGLQLKALSTLQSKASESVHLRQQIQTQQQQIQRDYLKKITGWQKKLETTTHIRMIVYI